MGSSNKTGIGVDTGTFKRAGRGLTILASALLIVGGMSGRASAQIIDISEPEEAAPRQAILYVGPGLVQAMSHFADISNPMVRDGEGNIIQFGDGFASWGTTLNFRASLPIFRKLDLVFDLTLPWFKVKTEKFVQASSVRITDARYYGKMLSVGGKWAPVETEWGRYFIIGTAGMYQLTFERFLNGVQRVTKGAFKDGGSIGLGVEYSKWILPVEAVFRYHRYTDFANFGSGDLAWIEIGVMLGFDLTPDDR